MISCIYLFIFCYLFISSYKNYLYSIAKIADIKNLICCRFAVSFSSIHDVISRLNTFPTDPKGATAQDKVLPSPKIHSSVSHLPNPH